MTEVTCVRIDEMDAVEGPGGMRFHRVRAELGVSSFGMSIIDIPPNATEYPEHDHDEEGIGGEMLKGRPGQFEQEEVYIALSGSGVVQVEGEQHPLDPDHIVRVGAHTKRKILPGDEGLRVLALGGVPGKAYEPD